FEKGRLLGSAHTRRSRALPRTGKRRLNKATVTINLREREHIEHASLVGVVGQVLHSGGKSQRRRLVASIQSARNDCSSPTADARQDGDVLLAIRTFVRRGLSNNSRTGLELPEKSPAFCIDGLEPPIERAVKDDISSGRERAAPHREAIGICPHHFP